MDLRTLTQIVTRRWWLVIPVFLITLGSAVVFTLGLPSRYQSGTTYIVTSGVLVPGNSPLDALSIVSRETEIANTYAEIAGSRQIKRQVQAQLQLTGGQLDDLAITPQIIPATNVLQIQIQGGDPQLAHDTAEAVGSATAAYVNGLYPEFELVQLDPALLPDTASQPNRPLLMGLGGLVAVALAIGAAVALELLRGPRGAPPAVAIADGSGAYSEAFLTLRLQEELSRSHRTGRPFSVALMDVDNGVLSKAPTETERQDVLRRLLAIFGEHVRTEDVIARVGDHVFGFLLPDRDRAAAASLMETLRSRARLPISDAQASAFVARVDPAVGGVTSFGGDPGPGALLKLADEALTEAQRDAEHAPVWFTLTSGPLEGQSAKASSNGTEGSADDRSEIMRGLVLPPVRPVE